MTGNSPIVNASAYFIGPIPPGLSTISEPANCTSFLSNPSYPDDKCTPFVFDIDAGRLLSYQGIMAAFNQLVLGDIQNQGTSVDTNTTIMRTILAQAEELAFIRDWYPSNLRFADFRAIYKSSLMFPSRLTVLVRRFPPDSRLACQSGEGPQYVKTSNTQISAPPSDHTLFNHENAAQIARD
jgi:hypothetical protein